MAKEVMLVLLVKCELNADTPEATAEQVRLAALEQLDGMALEPERKDSVYEITVVRTAIATEEDKLPGWPDPDARPTY